MLKPSTNFARGEVKPIDVGSGPILYFAAKDFDGAITGLKQRGIKVGEARREGNSPRFVIFWDSEGNVLGIEEALGM